MSNLTALCAINSTIDPSCDCLASGGGPQMNTDISGPGVRISFYLQALFLALLSARSESVEEITGALCTLIATNVAMAVTALFLGFKAVPEISFHDAIVVFYLLSLSWASLFFSLPLYNAKTDDHKIVKFVSVLQSYVLFAFAFAILSTAEHFGQTAPCNPHAVVVIFRSFRAIHAGVNVAWALVAIVVLVYSALTINDYNPEILDWLRKICKKRKSYLTQRDAELGEAGTLTVTASAKEEAKKSSENNNNKRSNKHDGENNIQERGETAYDLGIFGYLIVQITVIMILWALTVMNTELVITRNNFSDGDSTRPDSWQFGQIIPMVLVVLPLVNVINAFHKYKLQRHVDKLSDRARPRLPPTHPGDGVSGEPHGLGGELGGGLGGGLGGMPFNSFGLSPFGVPRPDGDLQSAHISADSFHSVHLVSSERSVHSSQKEESSSSMSSS